MPAVLPPHQPTAKPRRSFLPWCIAVLTACGGGGNESGPPDQVEASPMQVQVQGDGACAQGTGPTVHVHGGVPPYKVFNAFPAGMALNAESLRLSGDGVQLSFTGVCFDALPLQFEDTLGKRVSVPVSNRRGSAPTP